ncbi:MAG: hypothetical protein JWO65_2009 [Sphingomonas bacterium]|jgi:hypothetical protein|nr:hypothetical protein [Sphingomonas bacterium]
MKRMSVIGAGAIGLSMILCAPLGAQMSTAPNPSDSSRGGVAHGSYGQPTQGRMQGQMQSQPGNGNGADQRGSMMGNRQGGQMMGGDQRGPMMGGDHGMNQGGDHHDGYDDHGGDSRDGNRHARCRTVWYHHHRVRRCH